MNIRNKLLGALVLLAGLVWQPMAAAQAAPPAADAYTKKGADTCLGCHDDESATYTAGALFNYFVIGRGSGYGTHNPKYVKQILFDSIEKVTGAAPKAIPVRPSSTLAYLTP